MALTKIDIVQNVTDKLGLPKRDSTRIVESVFELMKEQLSKGIRSRYRVSAISP